MEGPGEENPAPGVIETATPPVHVVSNSNHDSPPFEGSESDDWLPLPPLVANLLLFCLFLCLLLSCVFVFLWWCSFKIHVFLIVAAICNL
jgi:hypothetical protein